MYYVASSRCDLVTSCVIQPAACNHYHYNNYYNYYCNYFYHYDYYYYFFYVSRP